MSLSTKTGETIMKLKILTLIFAGVCFAGYNETVFLRSVKEIETGNKKHVHWHNRKKKDFGDWGINIRTCQDFLKEKKKPCTKKDARRRLPFIHKEVAIWNVKKLAKITGSNVYRMATFWRYGINTTKTTNDYARRLANLYRHFNLISEERK